tara:strand:+ start:38576 stop:42319 length:3744 start_codon:yes stop_codon:yes gene_type:complete
MKLLPVFISLVFGLSLSTSFSQLTANFTANQLSICLGDGIQFTDLSTVGGSPITDWNWDFGDGNASTLQNPVYVYSTPGNYNITLTVQAQDGTSDFEVKALYITVSPLPTVGLGLIGAACNVPFNATFSNSSSSGNDFIYAWDFGNGQTSTDFNPSGITYNSGGTFTVSLVVTNTVTGCTDSNAISIDINDFNAAISAPLQACQDGSVQIDNATIPSSTSWFWNFGDGFTSSFENNLHTYATPGTYTITLTATDAVTGCSEIVTQDIDVLPLPTPSFTVTPQVGCAPLNVTFTNNSAGGGTFDWDFGNGNTFTGQNPPVQQYLTNGSYDVTLTMTDVNGCSNSILQTNAVDVQPLQVVFGSDITGGCSPIDVQFADSSDVPDPAGDPIVTWNWTFGNGNTFSGQNPPVQTYNLGVYDVNLSITTSNGCTADTTYSAYIEVGEIVSVDFSVTPLDDCAKSPFDFTDLSVITVPFSPGEVTYEWDFGDGGTSTDQNPQYNYPQDTGFFDVQLIVDFRGCRDSITKTDAVFIKAPISIFQASQTLFCNPTSLPLQVDFTDNSIIGAIPDDAAMTWSWGDGTFTYFDDPDFDDADLGSTVHSYNAYGTYTVQQAIYNYTTGCEDSTSVTISVTFTDASFTASNDSVCKNSPVLLVDGSTSSHPFGTYSYNLGNGDTQNGSVVSYTYNTAGSYDVILTSTNGVGCADSDTLVGMDVLELPLADISPSSLTGCAPFNTTFSNNSLTQGNGVGLSSFLWTFPDGSTQTTNNVATDVNFNHTTEGFFTTTLVVTDNFGCVSPASSVGITLTKPVADFILDTIVCDLESFLISNTSSGLLPIGSEWFIDGNNVGNTTNYSGQFDEISDPNTNVVDHFIQLVVTDVNGCMDTISETIHVSMPYANANYSFNSASINGAGQYVCPPVFASLTDTSSTYGTITDWDWTFGNGNSSIDQNPDNTYVFAGTYTATLMITDEFGCTSDTSFIDYLTIFGPQGELLATNVGDFCNPLYEFSSSNLISVNSIAWDMGDGNIVNDTNTFTYEYNSNGSYNPTAIVSDASGCAIPFDLGNITINSNLLNAFFTSSFAEGNIGDAFTFTDASTSVLSPIVQWNWNISTNNGIISNANPFDENYTWLIPGNQTVTLTVLDSNGCADSYTIVVPISVEVEIPNVLTANNDGVNDLFVLPYNVFSEFDLVILNRWGQVVQELRNATGTFLWDGRNLNGNECVEGVYFYKFVGTMFNNELIEKHGNVTLVR